MRTMLTASSGRQEGQSAGIAIVGGIAALLLTIIVVGGIIVGTRG
jgi:hypothetical protein